MTNQCIAPSEVRGVWAVALLPWDDNWQLDETSFKTNMDRIIAAKPNGFYSLDTASEFYTLEFEAWQAVARMFVEHCRAADASLPLGLGCTWTNQEGALDRIRTARDLGVQTIHLSAPYWTPIHPDALHRFYAAVQEVVGHLGIVIYAPPWSAIDLTGELYTSLKKEAPNIIGAKTGIQHPEIFSLPSPNARDSHFVGEPGLFEAMKLGATGCYSALAGISIPFMKQWISLMQDGQWDEAGAINERVQAFYSEAVVPCREAGVTNGAIDKAMAQIGGAVGSRLLRPPYLSMPDDLFNNLSTAAHKHLPDAFEHS